MAESEARRRWRPSPITLVAGGLVIAGFVLVEVNWWFFLLTAMGTLGPGFLREIGWLRDKDEFQRRADHRAGYHAFLTTALVAFVVLSYLRSADRQFGSLSSLASFFLVLLWFTWLFSSLLAYWGPKRTATRVLRVFGAVVLIFTIVSNLGPEWTGWTALLLHPLLSVPFFALAWLASRSPRLAGTLMIFSAAGFFLLLRGPRENLLEFVLSDTFVLILGPLLASGIALMAAGGDETDEGQADEAGSQG